jgi:hypothetical protein
MKLQSRPLNKATKAEAAQVRSVQTIPMNNRRLGQSLVMAFGAALGWAIGGGIEAPEVGIVVVLVGDSATSLLGGKSPFQDRLCSASGIRGSRR